MHIKSQIYQLSLESKLWKPIYLTYSTLGTLGTTLALGIRILQNIVLPL